MALTQIQQAMLADGILTADAAGRLKMADGFVNAAKLGAGAARANWGAGGVLQVVSASTATQVTTTASSYSDFLTATITPASTSNKIIVLGFVPFGMLQNLNGTRDEVKSWYQLTRNGSQITEVHHQMGGTGWGQAGKRFYGNSILEILDTPSLASAVTYKIQHMADESGTYATLQSSYNNKTSSLILLEVAG